MTRNRPAPENRTTRRRIAPGTVAGVGVDVMDIAYFAPLQKAWDRMVTDLFRPFRAGRWFAVGFAAWLVALGRGGGGGGGASNWKERFGHHEQGGNGLEALRDRLNHVLEQPWIVTAVVVGILVLLALVLILSWLGARFEFVFLDQVARRHWKIAEPWRRHAVQGNSLFFWKLGLTILLLLCVAAALTPLVLAFARSGRGMDLQLGVATVLFVLAAIVVGVATALFLFFLNNFIVPIMYREGLSASQGFSRFRIVFASRPWAFIGCALLILVLAIGLGVLACASMCLTLCCTLILLAIPYLSTVLTLPIWYTYRAFGPEFLSQFGPEWWTWPEEPSAVAGDAPPAAPGA